MQIRKGDTVEVITGKDRGQSGVVERRLVDQNKVVVSGLNMVKRHVKAASNKPGGIVEQPAPIDVSNVMLVCPSCKMKTRVVVQGEGKDKVRVCKKCHKQIKGK